MIVPYRIPTGCKTIDRVLEGGISSDKISLVYGEEETGKTTFALQCAANCARHGFKTLFIDCDSTFYAKRLSQIASEGFEKIAEQIILTRPTDFREQTMIIDHLSDYVTKTFGLVVIDTITSLYRAKVSESPGKAFELNRELNRQLGSLAQFVKIQKIAILMNSQVRTAFKEETVSIEPVAERVLKFWADTIIWLKPTENPQIIKAILEKSPAKAQPAMCHLKIEESGLREYHIR
jgi:DNA repair protein RadB